MKKYGFLFGAGAEARYGLPLGEAFSLDIFKESDARAKELFKGQREKVHADSEYAKNYLPTDYKKRSVLSFTERDFQVVMLSTLEQRRGDVISRFNEFDSFVDPERMELLIVDNAGNAGGKPWTEHLSKDSGKTKSMGNQTT